jgi:hypothetical protein
MGANSGWDAIVFGEVVFPEGGVMAWVSEVYHRVAQLEKFDAQADEELAQILVTPVGVAVRCWLFSNSFQEWCPRLEAMFSLAAKQGGRGDVVFLGVGDGPAYRLIVENGRSSLQRIPMMGFEHPTVQEIALAVELKSERRKAAALAAAEAAAEAEIAALRGRT